MGSTVAKKDKVSETAQAGKGARATRRKEPQGFIEGDRVTHATFGNGKVISVRGDKITVEFEENIIKEILDIFLKRKR